MTAAVALYLGLDGVANGAIYALLAVAIVVVFSVTRIIFVPQGEFISYGALSFVALQHGQVPGTIPLLFILACAVAAVEIGRIGQGTAPLKALAAAARVASGPVIVSGLAYLGTQADLPLSLKAVVAVAVVAASGPLLHRLVYQPIADASILVLLIVSVALHFVMTGIALYIFGPSSLPSAPLIDVGFEVAGVPVTAQTILTLAVALGLILLLFVASRRTLYGKAMLAVSVNRNGARLMGISASLSGRIAFLLAALIGAVSGVLIAPSTTILYDTGFILGLKGFVAAIIGGMVSYPLAGLGAIGIGLIESYSAFLASSYKEIIVFTLVIPILLVRSLLHPMGRDEEEVEAPALDAPAAMSERAYHVRRWIVRAALALFSAFVVAAPFLLSSYHVALMNYVGLAAIVVLGLVLLTGVAGLTSFAQAAYLGIGAYVTGYLSTALGLSPWLTLPIALAAAGCLAVVGGAITIRLSGHYLPLVTLALAIVAYYLFGSLEFTGGQSGMSNIPPLRLFGVDLSTPESIYAVVWLVLIGSMLLLHHLLDSRTGRAIRSLRYGVTMAESVAVDTRRMKMASFVIACLLAALAGWLYAHAQRFINPSPFSFNQGITYLFMAVIGGAGSLFGAVAGAGIVILGSQWLQTSLPALLGVQGDFEIVAFGIIAILILHWLPAGIWPAVVGALKLDLPKRWPKAAGVSRLAERPKPAAGSVILSVAGVSKHFGAIAANKDISLEARAGEILALIGPNGAGKSTLFDLISGAQRPSSGTVRFLGEESSYSLRAFSLRGMARTFQHTRIVPDMSVLENVALGAHARGKSGLAASSLRLDRAEEAELIAEASHQLARVGLGDMPERKAGSLALGQQRLLEIARALCSDPCLLLLDEPAAGLRHLEKKALGELLRRLKAEGVGVVVVEHDMDFVMNLADRVVVMQFGEKLAEGAPLEIQSNPAVIEAYLGEAE